MGATTELVVQTAAAVASAGAMTALARSLSVWLVQRRADITVTVTRPDGRKVEVTARRVDPEYVLRAVSELATPDPAEQTVQPNPASEPHTA